MKSKKLIFFFLFAGLIVTGIYASKNNVLLKTTHAPRGMASFSFSRSQSEQSVIINEWKRDTVYILAYSRDSLYYAKPVLGLQTAIDQRTADFGFIFFYVAFLGFLIYEGKSDFKGFPSWGVVIAVLIVGAAVNAIGNALELSALNGGQGLVFFIFTTSLIKWLSLAFCVAFYYTRVLRPRQAAFLSEVSKFMSQALAEFWNFRIVLIGLLILYAVLNLVDQGEDLLVAIGDSMRGTIWFVLTIFVLALLNWYLPKIYDNVATYKDQKKGFEGPHSTIKTYLGRLIGSVTLLVPATGLLSAMKTYHVPYWLEPLPVPLLFLAIVFFYIYILHHKILDRLYLDKDGKFIESRYWITLGLIVLIIGILVWSIGSLSWPLGSLSLIFFLLSFLFLLSVNYRSEFKMEIPFLPVLYIAAAIVALLFLAFNFRFISAGLTARNRYYSLPVFIAGMVFYTMLASFLLLLGRRLKLQLITLILLVTFIISNRSITGFHRVATFPKTISPAVHEDSLRTYIHHWLESRRAEIKIQSEGGLDYPVFFVNADGGGIKAAAWTAMAVGRLNFLMRQTQGSFSAKPDFEHYVFSYSGASGGTIGESLLTGARLHYMSDQTKNNVFSDTSQLMQVFKHDYLTNDLVGIIGRDVLMGSLGLNCYDDRAKVTEKAFEDYTRPLGISYDTAMRLGWHDPKMDVPLMFCNTFDINAARKGIMAPVLLRTSDFPGVILIRNLVGDSQDIHLSSAAFLSARFPYVSPTGKFDEKHHFTDGGTIENSGAETSLQLIKVFNSIRDSLTGKNGRREDTIFKRIRICILSLPNSIPAIAKIEKTKNSYEGTAPILGILRTISGNSDKAEAINLDSAKIYHWRYFQMAPMDAKIKQGNIHPILPLGWQISDYALEMMQATAQRDTSALIMVVNLFKTNFPKRK